MFKLFRRLISFINRRLPEYFKVLTLRLAGVDADWSARIHWSVVIQRGGGAISIGKRTSLDRGVLLRSYGGVIQIGADCSVNPYSVIYGDGGLTIGNGVRIAAHTVIIPANHIFLDPDRYIFEQGESRLGITIGDDVWLGAGVRVLDGVDIKKGTVIGAGAVVTKSTEAFGVYVGVPAKKISSRLVDNNSTLG